MGINLGAGFENLNGNSSISNQSAGILNLNKNDILDLTKRNPGLKKVVIYFVTAFPLCSKRNFTPACHSSLPLCIWHYNTFKLNTHFQFYSRYSVVLHCAYLQFDLVGDYLFSISKSKKRKQMINYRRKRSNG